MEKDLLSHAHSAYIIVPGKELFELADRRRNEAYESQLMDDARKASIANAAQSYRDTVRNHDLALPEIVVTGIEEQSLLIAVWKPKVESPVHGNGGMVSVMGSGAVR